MKFTLKLRPLIPDEKLCKEYYMVDEDDFYTGLQALYQEFKNVDEITDVTLASDNSFVIETRCTLNEDELRQKIHHIFSDLFGNLRLESLTPL